jgi:hypothetical protein
MIATDFVTRSPLPWLAAAVLAVGILAALYRRQGRQLASARARLDAHRSSPPLARRCAAGRQTLARARLQEDGVVIELRPRTGNVADVVPLYPRSDRDGAA